MSVSRLRRLLLRVLEEVFLFNPATVFFSGVYRNASVNNSKSKSGATQHVDNEEDNPFQNLFRRTIPSLTFHYRMITSSERLVFSDQILKALFTDESSLVAGTVVRDHYEKILQEKARTFEIFEKFNRYILEEKQHQQRELMYYRGVLHTRGLMEEFKGYVKALLQPNSSSPMTSRKLYTKMLELGSSQSKTSPIVTEVTRELVACFGGKLEDLSDHEKTTTFNTIANEMEHVYSCLSHSIHSMKLGRHERDLVICV